MNILNSIEQKKIVRIDSISKKTLNNSISLLVIISEICGKEKMKNIPFLIIIILLFSSVCRYSQIIDKNSAEIFIVDSYVSDKLPHKFHLYFFTNDSVKSAIIIAGKYKAQISNKFTTNHKFEMDFTKLNFGSAKVPFQVLITYADGTVKKSDIFKVELPYNAVELKAETPGLFQMCLGGILFFLPSPGLVVKNGKSNLSLTLEFPLISFYSDGFNYPSGYISAGYSHQFGTDKKNYLKLGYQKIFDGKFIEFISPGLHLFTNFKGDSGIAPEITFGLLKIAGVFTLYTRYNYSFSFEKSATNFQEISIGLFTNFFSINL